MKKTLRRLLTCSGVALMTFLFLTQSAMAQTTPTVTEEGFELGTQAIVTANNNNGTAEIITENKYLEITAAKGTNSSWASGVSLISGGRLENAVGFDNMTDKSIKVSANVKFAEEITTSKTLNPAVQMLLVTDEGGQLYFNKTGANNTNRCFVEVTNKSFDDTWFEVSFNISLYEGKFYTKSGSTYTEYTGTPCLGFRQAGAESAAYTRKIAGKILVDDIKCINTENNSVYKNVSFDNLNTLQDGGIIHTPIRQSATQPDSVKIISENGDVVKEGKAAASIKMADGGFKSVVLRVGNVIPEPTAADYGKHVKITASVKAARIVEGAGSPVNMRMFLQGTKATGSEIVMQGDVKTVADRQAAMLLDMKSLSGAADNEWKTFEISYIIDEDIVNGTFYNSSLAKSGYGAGCVLSFDAGGREGQYYASQIVVDNITYEEWWPDTIVGFENDSTTENKVNCTITLKNGEITNNSEALQVFLAEYDADGRLVSVSIDKTSLTESNSSTTLSCVKTNAANIVKAYIWGAQFKPTETYDITGKKNRKLMATLKLDDLSVDGNKSSIMAFERAFGVLDEYGIEAKNAGMIGEYWDISETAGAISKAHLDTVKNWISSGGFELWHHGYKTSGEDYSNYTTVGENYESLAKTCEIAERVFGVKLTAFGAPRNTIGEMTIEALKSVPQLGTAMLVLDAEGTLIEKMHEAGIETLDTKFALEKEVGVVSYDAFLGNVTAAAYATAYDSNADYCVMQGHPCQWDDADYIEFRKILDFLKNPESCGREVIFVNPSQAGKLKARMESGCWFM